MHYRHTHIGYLMIVIFGIGLLLILGRPWSLIGIGLFVVCLALFPTLTIEIVDRTVIWYFGLGLIRRKVELKEICRVAVVDNPFSKRWAINPTWFYNVSGPHAVEMELTNGRIIRLGTDRAEELAKIIENARQKEEAGSMQALADGPLAEEHIEKPD